MKVLLRIFLTIFVALGIVLGTLFVSAYVLKDRMVPFALNQINRYLQHPVETESATISILKDFPNISVVLHNVSFGNNVENESRFQLQELGVSFSIFELWGNSFTIRSIRLKGGNVRLVISNRTIPFLKQETTSDEPSETEYSIHMPRIVFQDISLEYLDVDNGWNMLFEANKSRVEAFIDENRYGLQIEFNGIAHRVEQRGMGYIYDESIHFLAQLHVDAHTVSVQNGTLHVGNSLLDVDVAYGRSPQSPIDIAIKGNKFDVRTLTSILAQQSLALPKGMRTRGSIDFSLNLGGTNGDGKPLTAIMDFRTEKLEMAFPGKPKIFLQGADGHYANNAFGSSEAELNFNFRELRSGNSIVGGAVRVKNPSSPRIYANITPNIIFSDVNTWLPNQPLVQGWAKGDLEILGSLDNLNNIKISDLGAFRGSGQLLVGNIQFKYMDEQLHFDEVNGAIGLEGSAIKLDTLRGNLNGAPFVASLTIPNVFRSIAGVEKWVVGGNLQFDFINTSWFGTPKAEAQGEPVAEPMPLDMASSVKIKRFKHDGFECTNLTANVSSIGNAITFNNFEAAAVGGRVAGKFAIDDSSDGNYKVYGDLNVQSIDINALFSSFNNFGQEEIVSENIRGNLTGTATFIVPFIKGALDDKSLGVVSNVVIENGQLTGLKQLEGLSRFFSLEELNRIQFQKMQNTISIEKGEISIPQMEVFSSLLHFICSGTHSIDGDYTYRLKMNLGDVLFNKVKRNSSNRNEFGVIESDGTGRTPLFVKVVGTTDKQQVSFDTDAAKASTKAAIRAERETIGKALKEEFGSLFGRKADTTLKAQTKFGVEFDDEKSKETPINKEKEKKSEPKKKTKFIIEWE